MSNRILVTALCALVNFSTAVAQKRKSGKKNAAVAPAVAAALPTYHKYLGRLPFIMHTRGREKFARLGHPDALRILSESYDQKWMDTPVDQHNYLLVAICRKQFGRVEHLDLHAAWRKRFRRDQDSWLWFKSLQVHQRIRGEGAAIAALQDPKQKLFVRMAALQALGDGVPASALPAIGRALSGLPDNPSKKDLLVRSVTLRSAAAALLGQQRMLGTTEFRDALEPLIRALDHKSTDLQTKIVIARHLRQILKTEQLFVDARPWQALLAGETGRKDKYAHLYAKPKFFGVEASGTRIAYVIDMSDSMCKPFSADFLKDKPKGPITGPKKKRKGDGPDADAIPWRIVKNRFDLAREQLKLSLRKLGPDKYFTVAWFGDQAGLLKSTKGMVKASKKNIKKAIAELDAIKPLPKTTYRPDGRLRGKTNLHGGILCAFRATKRGLLARYEHVAADGFRYGCDTIFVLSDGDPTWDNWPMDDKNYGEDQVGDPESRKKMATHPIMHYSGPYRNWYRLTDDVERMNLFRKVEIQCIAIGDVQVGALHRLALLGMGKAHNIGAVGDVIAWLERALGQVSRARVAVFGDFAVDAYWDLAKDDGELSIETGKPVRKVADQRYSLGGAGNICASLAALNVASVHAIGLIGEDLFGDHMLYQMAALGIQTGSMLRCQPDWQTSVFAKPQRDGVEQSRIDFGAFDELTQASFDRLQNELTRAANNCELVILNQQIPVGICPSPVIAWLNELIAEHPKGRFLVDSRDRPHEFDGAMLKMNESEARRMQDDKSGDFQALVRTVQERADAPVCITRSERGLAVADGDELHEVEGIPIEGPVDPCGAGDTALAALAAAIAGGVELPIAARLANLAAAVTVPKLGTTGTATHDEIRALCESKGVV